MLSALCVIAVAAVVYFAVGAAWQGSVGQPAFALHVAGRDWNWIGAGRFFLRGLELGGWSSLPALFGLMSAGLAAIIPLGSGADRWRLGASCASTCVARRLDLSSICTLGVGRRMARATGFYR